MLVMRNDLEIDENAIFDMMGWNWGVLEGVEGDQRAEREGNAVVR